MKREKKLKLHPPPIKYSKERKKEIYIDPIHLHLLNIIIHFQINNIM